jgi:transposase-like protein
MKPKQVKISQPSVLDFFARIPDEDSARAYLESGRWPNGIICIHCQHNEIWKVRGGKLYTCKGCRKQFTIRTGTVMEDSKIPLQKWIYAMYLMTVSRKGISSIQMAKELGITQKSSWFMAMRIRESCQSNGIMSGTVEVDETYIGGKAKNMHASAKAKSGIGTGGKGKTIVMGLKSRSGEVRTKVIESTQASELHPVIKANVAVGSTVYTDEHTGYEGLKDYKRDVVCHSAKEYVVGDAHTNGIESHWAILKRAHMGTFHHWSKKHTFRYADEFSFKQNTKELPAFDKDGNDCGITTVRAHLAGMEGRRLTYKNLIQ